MEDLEHLFFLLQQKSGITLHTTEMMNYLPSFSLPV